MSKPKATALEMHATFCNVGRGITSDLHAKDNARAACDWILNAVTGDKAKTKFWQEVRTELNKKSGLNLNW